MVDRPFLFIVLFFVVLVGAFYSVKIHKQCGSPGAQNATNPSVSSQAAPDVTKTTCHWVVSWRW